MILFIIIINIYNAALTTVGRWLIRGFQLANRKWLSLGKTVFDASNKAL